MASSGSDQNEPISPKHPPPQSPSPEFGGDPVALKDFSSRRQVPGFAKVVKGSYMTLGHSKFSFQKQHQEVFIHSVRVSVKVLAHCLRRVEGHNVVRRGGHNLYANSRLYGVDQRLAIPISYQGWFELLSEDGKSARPIMSVHELSKVKPDRCLVRENIKAYLPSEDGETTFDNTKIVIAGEQLVLNGEISLPTSSENKKIKLLRCFDSKGEIIYLSFDQKGTFTPIAGENDFTGVFSIRDIVRRFRLPLTVKLVMGVRPKVDPSKFTGLIRLDWAYTDETAFVCPIEKNHVRLLPVPKEAPLQLMAATNQQVMKDTELYRTMVTKCNRMIANYNNTLHLIVQMPAEVMAKGKPGRSPNANVFSMSLDKDTSTPASVRSRIREERLMNEIDNLYAYVRDGGPSPPTSKFTYDSDEESYWEEPAYEPLDDFQARLRALEAGEKVTYPAQYQPRDPAQLALDLEAAGSRRSDDTVHGFTNGSSGSGKNSGKEKPPKLPLPFRPPDLLVTQRLSSSAINANPTSAIKSPNNNPPAPPATNPPPVPIRRYSSENVTTVSNMGMVSSNRSSNPLMPGKPPESPSRHQPLSPTTAGPGNRRFLHSKSVGDVYQVTRQSKQNRPQSSQRRSGGNDSNSTSGSSSGNGRMNIARDFKDSDISSVTRAGSSGSSGKRAPVSNVRKKLQTLYL
ncbi:grb2-associated and regulator of mapk protein [Plakobranchus ocellatus]|uniref:Grb2-associated and regulator of mapk protein n=1 Tax=Plakobranchus ocellatus TaxID=259542 RepID=A0AAV4B3T7_9GAST|nr:grb2-associated and regulator of mapk protein [Plakobranchus ocellatus]